MGFESSNEEGEFEEEKKEINGDNDVGEKSNDNEWDEIDWSEVNSDEQEESIWNDINWNDDETGEQEESIWSEIDWEEPESEKQTESDSKDEDGELEPEQLNPNESEENYKGNEYEQCEKESDDESNYDSYENGDNFEQEEYSGGFYENSYAESMNTILLSENQIYEYLQEYIELMGKKEHEVKQGEQAEVDDSKEEVSELEKFLEEERERIQLEQQQADLDEIIENDPKSELVVNEAEVEQEQKENLETQENISEETFSYNEDEVENLEMELEEEFQSALPNESIEGDKFEEVEEENEEPQPNGNEEKIEEQENNLKFDVEKDEEYEQHQYEAKIEEENEIELESTVHEEEMERIKEEHKEKEDHEEFIKEGESSQIKQELEVNHEIKSSETEVLTIHQEELGREITSPYMEEEHREIEEFEDPQQELEGILKQNRKIEQQALLEIKKEEIDSEKPSKENYERVKKLYHLQTGKRSIYANKETKGFKEWLEQNIESEGKLKGDQSKELKVEQEKEEEWMIFLKNWIEKESGEEISSQMKNEIIQIIENYKELEELATKFQKLYKQKEVNQLSQSAKKEFKTLIKTLQKSDPSNIVLFTNLRTIKHYLSHQKLSKAQKNRMLNHFFTRFSPIKQLNQIFTHKNNSYTTSDLINNLLQTVPDIDDQFKNLSKTKLLENISTIIFSKGKHFLKHILSKIRNSNNSDYNPNYKFSIKVLKIAEENIKNKFGSSSELALKHLEKYRHVNRDLKHYYHEQWRKYNPNLKSRFFEQLNSTKKTYWFGFLSSDGSITSGNDPSRKRYQISIEISKKDRNHLVKFCRAVGLNPEKIGERTRILNNKKFPVVYIIFTCKPMFQDLENLGFREFKEGNELKFDLKNNNLSYALLLGLYDGDGKEGGTYLYSTNYSVLQQIKNVYKIKTEIRKREIDEMPEELKFKIKRTKPIYEFALSAILLNKMMRSHPNSLTRKRKKFSEQKHVMETIKSKIGSPEVLEKLIKTHGKEKLAKMLNISFNTLHKLTNEWDVNVKILSAVEKLKAKVKTKEKLISMIETKGREKTAEELKTGYKSLLNLMNEWNINTNYLNKRELLKKKIGSKEKLEGLLRNSSLTQLAKKYGVGRNTLKRLYDEWEI